MSKTRRSYRIARPVVVDESILTSTDEDVDEDNLENINLNKVVRKRTSAQPARMETSYKTPTQNKSKRKSKICADIEADDSDSTNVSPPKLPKPDSLFSPSRLMDRLSIDATDSDDDVHEEREQPRVTRNPSKYENARKVLNGAETDILPGREGELSELKTFLRDHLDAAKSGSLYVSGQPGTGKTACLTHILRCDEIASKFVKVYINCTAISTLGSIYKKICTELKLKSSGRSERESLQAIDRYLAGKHKMVLMILDEIDQLVGKKQSILYTIFEWPSKPNSKILLIGIANSLDLTDRTLTRLNAKCELKPKLLHFPPYSKDQLIAIFKSRLETAGVLNVFPPVTIQLLAAKVAAVSGDVRRALDIGRRVVELAEQQKKGKTAVDLTELGIGADNLNLTTADSTADTVPMSLVVTVLNDVYGASQNFNNDIEDTFPLQQKILVCCLLLILMNDKNKDVTIGRLHDIFKRVCHKRNLLAVDQAEFVGLCSLVETRGIIRMLNKKEPRLNKIVLQWDQQEVVSALKDKQLIATILDDTTCLKK